MNFEAWLKKECPSISLSSASAVIELNAQGATLPFIARYRKEKTGGLDELGIQAVLDAKENFEAVIKRQQFILGEIETQKKLTDELKTKILTTFDLSQLEDLYLPYKVKKKSKATLAKEAGLEPLADWIWGCGHGTVTPEAGQTLSLWALTYRNEEKNILDAEAAIAGASDILIERLAEDASLRQKVRETVLRRGHLVTGKGKKFQENSKFENYAEFNESITSLMKPESSHRYLAIRRGWMEDELTLVISNKPGENSLEEELLAFFSTVACSVPKSECASVLLKVARLAFKAYVLPSIENEVHAGLREVADAAAIKVFSENVKKLLLASPFGSKAVLGVDPGIRTGCKVAMVDASGKFMADTVFHLQTEHGKQQAKAMIAEVAQKCNLQAIAVGNGTAGRETEAFLRTALRELNLSIPVAMVNEAGASVYSASAVAREEFPELDVTVRGAISIARRLQDPLAELVKIEPKSIGVGQYQHDVSQPALKKNLDLVVDVCVNSVGVNLNTASYHLLSHVAGIGPSLAKSIVEHRASKGLFKSKQALLGVSRFSDKTLEQAAGFLRVPQAEHPLDNTGVHPERYADLEELAQKMGVTISALLGAEGVKKIRESRYAQDLKQKIGDFTFDDILKELEKPGRDPRETFAVFSYRDDIFEIKDVKPDMICPGIVTNVTNFGAFIDIGVHQDGLAHLSQLSHKFIKDPREVVSPGDKVTVKVLEVNVEKKQISLTLKLEAKADFKSHQNEKSSPPSHAKGPQKPSFPQKGKPAGKPLTHNPFAALAGFKKDRS